MTRLPRQHALRGTPPRRTERGATTAEYVGMVGVVVILVIALVALAPVFSSEAKSVIDKAMCRIGAPLGFAGCSNDALPDYVPTNCTVSSHEGNAGGSVSIIADVGGESGYKLTRIRERQDDGSIKDTYVVRTKGQVGGGYEFTLGGGAEVSTGSSDTSAKAGASAKLEGDFSWGKEYTFDNLDDAQAFVDEYKDNFGEFGSEPDGAPAAASEYYELGAKGSLKGVVGPAELSGGVRGVLGLQTYANGDKKVKVAMTVEAALQIGIPVPESLLKLGAEGKISAMVMADVTFDEDGNLAAFAGSIQATPTVAGGVEWNTDLAKPSTGKHAKPQTLQGLTLPPILRMDFGRNYVINFSTSFRRDDGSYDHAALDALSQEMSSFITGGDGMSPEQQSALSEQLNEHSQITFNEYDYSRSEEKYGGKVKVLFVKVGAEVHVVTIDQDLLSGYYYDPVQGLWSENVVCES